MKSTAWFEEFQKNVSELIAKSPAADLERNVKAFIGQAFTRMDLVTREDFEVQADLLSRAQVRIESLEQQLHALETRVATLEKSP
ncbi:MAG: accessory factor UbiK family protein [Burkholderiaceae bacterium]|jgi:ubiquinone biosynthesis accessory factor UbiK|nr:accessory factor UbiK family protein [Burkholderiaceae bacterium]MDP4909984.1 accessory factor UbiK family protein [Burkholderiaceae bacterium]MDP4969328.1 accessory factor UbiK family protein [Burkholderiaceae bacterium]